MESLVTDQKKILLLSAYDAQSHRVWREGLVQEFDTEFEWTVLSLPPRSFSWRIRGNAFSWTMKKQDVLEQKYDLILATSMTDLSTLRGLNPQLTKIPTIVYFHENQFVYPIQNEVVQREVFHFCMLNLYTGMCGDRLLFNSDYNRQSFLDGALKLLRKMPDYAPKSIIETLRKKSFVVPVPLRNQLWDCPKREKKISKTLKIIWNHRWEYDKDPNTFFEALRLLKENAIPFELFLLGQQFRDIPKCFIDAKVELKEEIQQYGFVDSRSRYEEILQQGDVVVSTAIHEFQGLAMIEAIAFGCIPIAPNHLVYPEYIPQSLLFDVDESQQQRAKNLYLLLKKIHCEKKNHVVDVSSFSWGQSRHMYARHIWDVIESDNC
jgi:glycosyltransferase involved in cell wall biosynthesis